MNPTHNSNTMHPIHSLMGGMHYVYILQSLENKGFYIGCTSNLEERIAAHNRGDSYHTRKYAP